MTWRVGAWAGLPFQVLTDLGRSTWVIASVVALCLAGCSRESSYKTRRLEPRAASTSQDTTVFVPPFVRDSLPSSAEEFVNAYGGKASDYAPLLRVGSCAEVEAEQKKLFQERVGLATRSGDSEALLRIIAGKLVALQSRLQTLGCR